MITRAKATISGGPHYPNINGEIYFTQINYYVEIVVRIYRLPSFSREDGKTVGPFGFHLHTGQSCEKGTKENPFPQAGEHYNPHNQPHGNHAGDFPILMPLKDGTVVMRFLTDKFKLDDVVGRAVVIHESPDDYRTQPAGGSGIKIACGIIKPL
ncbi:MAG: superoxide dismutase family protein [Christensenellales bacterium]